MKLQEIEYQALIARKTRKECQNEHFFLKARFFRILKLIEHEKFNNIINGNYNELNLSCKRITNTEINLLCSELFKEDGFLSYTKIKKIDFSNNKFGNRGLLYLSNALKTNEAITEIVLELANFNDEPLKDFIKDNCFIRAPNLKIIPSEQPILKMSKANQKRKAILDQQEGQINEPKLFKAIRENSVERTKSSYKEDLRFNILLGEVKKIVTIFSEKKVINKNKIGHLCTIEFK